MPSSVSRPPEQRFSASYTSRDLILYGLGIGCCFEDDFEDGKALDNESCFVFEQHEQFQPFPTFPLALAFSAVAEGRLPEFGVVPFPPKSMRGEGGSGMLPRVFLRDNDVDLSLCPAVHVSQSLRLYQPLPVPITRSHSESGDDRVWDGPYDPPVCLSLSTQIVSVIPKRAGTFITTETEYRMKDKFIGAPICAARSTVLLVGVPPDTVIPYQREEETSILVAPELTTLFGTIPWRSIKSSIKKSPQKNKLKPDFSMQYQIQSNQALLYRLSGDYNPLHVYQSLSDFRVREGQTTKNSKPVLHGLCTLGFAVRAILRYFDTYNPDVTYVSCGFVRPVLVGDRIRVSVWDGKHREAERGDDTKVNSRRGTFLCCFQVHNIDSEVLVVDRGLAEFTACSSLNPKSNVTLSKL